jgi:glycosyltransferase involved in cell wall biosynthesis
MNLPIPYYLPIVARKEIKDFDVIHIHEYRAALAVVSHHYAKKYGVPFVLQPHGSIPRINKNKQKKLFDVLFGHSIVKDANKIITSSKIETEQYWDVFPDLKSKKIFHMPSGTNLKTYQNLPKKGKFKERYSINADEKIILFLSRIHERKGADILLEAFSKIKKEFEKVKLVIAGPDEGYLDELKFIASNLNIDGDVIFPGLLSEKDKLKAYVDADVFVLPSKDRYESFGVVVLEAGMCGTPSVVTKVCGVSEWLDNVILVDPSVSSLEGGIKEIFRMRRNKLGKKARKEAEEFSWDKIVGRIEKVYEEVVNCSA